MLAFFSSRRREDALPASTKEQRRRIDKATIGVPVLRSIPRRFEIYAGNYTRDFLARSISQRSGTNIVRSAAFPADPSPPTPRHSPDHSPYPLIRSYSLPSPICPPLSLSSRSTSTGPASSLSPLRLESRRPLSPILESCISPVSLRPTSASPDSEISTLDLPRPVARPPPFVQRSLSKTSGTSVSDGPPPSLPALNLTPHFPGPHPSQDGNGPPRRPPKALTLSARSSVFIDGATNSSGSLHAESFVTASNSIHIPACDGPLNDLPLEPTYAVAPSATSSTLPVSRCGSQHLDRHGTFGSGGSLRLKRQHFIFATPAFCAFWLGFLFPPVWWVGGWYFTLFAETPPQRTLWEHYVADTRWWAVLTCGGQQRTGRKRSSSPPKPLLLPRWVGKSNTTASLQGISYYYPFVSRPAPGHITTGPPPPGFRRLHKLFDELTRSRLERVKLAQESPRRIIDPWIGRCRRALCYWSLMFVMFIIAMMCWSFAVGAGKSHY